VEAAVLDEDGAGVYAGDRAAGDEETWHVGLEGHGVVHRGLPLVEPDARAAHQVGIRAIAGQ
jgi:hypothetical protein